MHLKTRKKLKTIRSLVLFSLLHIVSYVPSAMSIIEHRADELGKPIANGTPDQNAWDVFGKKPADYGWLSPSDPKYGIPKYQQESHIIFDGTGYAINKDAPKYTPQQMADYLIENTTIFVKNLLLLKKLAQDFLTNNAVFDLLKKDTNPFTEMTLSARDVLNGYIVKYVKPFYDSIQKNLISIEKTLAKNSNIQATVWKPALEQLKAQNKALPILLDSASPNNTIHEAALSHYWVENLRNIIQQLDTFLDSYDLRGTKHPVDYTPPPMDHSKNYWKNQQGQWCSGYGVVFEKETSLQDSVSKKYSLFRKEPITGSTDYSITDISSDPSQDERIPESWFSPIQQWETSKKRDPFDAKNTKTLDDLDIEVAQDLIDKIKSILPGYNQIQILLKEHWNKGFACAEFPHNRTIYDEALRGYKKQLTLLIMRLFGPFYDRVQENLILAEKTIVELGHTIPQENWMPFVQKWIDTKERPLHTLLHQDSPEKKLAAAHYLVKMLQPLEEKMDVFLDQNIYLRGEIYLFDFEFISDSVDSYSNYRWINAHGYVCRGFGRLLSPRKPIPPINYQKYCELRNN